MERQSTETSGPERLAFDSDLFAPSERLTRYREANGQAAEAQEAGPAFTARFLRWRLDRMVLHDRYLNDVTHDRSQARALADGLDHFMAHIVCSGSYEVDGGEGFRLVTPGEVIFVDMTKSMRSRAGAAKLITMSMARHLIEGMGIADDLHCKVIEHQAAALFAEFAATVARRAPELRDDMIGGVTRALVSLLSAAVEPTAAKSEAVELTDVDVARLNRVQRIIEQSLGNPMFGPDMVVVQSGLSRATLYRLFKPRGGLRAYIQRRRLDRVRVALSSNADRRALGAIAGSAGFLSEGHCSRQFLGAFGIRPGEYRAEVADAEISGGCERRLDYWLEELR
ncbi:MAG: helix-turn-helix domain-containing protein [Sphingomonadales bacterium]|nr:MAG: helix-turn-helix domain-containing protein [Sphingomonadales bacterium]